MILVYLTLLIVCLDGVCWSPHDVIRDAYDYIRTIYDFVLVMHNMIGMTHVHIKMIVRVPVVISSLS